MSKLQTYAIDPLDFFEDLVVPSAHGNVKFGSVMADMQYAWFEAIAPSLLAVAKGVKPPIGRYWTERTKGASKDSDVACCLLWLLAFCPRKLDVQVGASDRDQAAEMKKAAADVLRLNEWLQARVEVQSWSLVCKATGSQVDIIAADVAGSHGARPDVVVLNELSHVTKEEFASNLLDNATKKPQGLVVIATNAGFQATWQHKWRELYRRSNRWHFSAFSEPAPWLSEAELEEAEKRNSRSRFARLFWGQWITSNGDALDQADIDGCVDMDLGPMGRRDGWFYVGGLDLGIKHDHSALVVVGGNRKTQQLQLAYAESWKPSRASGKVDLMQVEATCLSMFDRYRWATCGYDPYQCELMAQRLTTHRVKMKEVTFTGANLNNMASTLLDVFRSRRIVLYNCQPLIRDLSRLTIVEKSYGHKLEATRNEDGHADVATALAIALPLAVEELKRTPKIAGAVTEQVGAWSPTSRADHFRHVLRQARSGGVSEYQEGFARAMIEQARRF